MQFSQPANRRESGWLGSRPVLMAIRARARLLLWVGSLVFAVFGAFISLLPKRYEAHMDFLATDKLAAESLRSTALLTRVVLKTALQRNELAEDNFAGETTPFTVERALSHLRQDLQITPVKKSNLLRVSYSGGTPEVTSNVLRALAATYLQKPIDVRSHPRAHTLLRNQDSIRRGGSLVPTIAVVEGPTPPVEQSNPQTTQDLLLAFACSLGCGLVVVLGVELFTVGQLQTYAAVKAMTVDRCPAGTLSGRSLPGASVHRRA